MVHEDKLKPSDMTPLLIERRHRRMLISAGFGSERLSARAREATGTREGKRKTEVGRYDVAFVTVRPSWCPIQSGQVVSDQGLCQLNYIRTEHI